MSQSPEEAVGVGSPDALLYRQGWRALNRLLHEDRSFSGRERNCAFLNLGDGSFADMSAASGFDFADDARAVVTTDWDFDGDLDVWTTNRTAPRVRFLQNRMEGEPADWLAFRLGGDGGRVNRDAVGARVEVFIKGGGAPLWREVTTGDGFLSQSGSWLHFGLGGGEIERVEVVWPGGERRELTGVDPGGFYDVLVSDPQLYRWTPPERGPLEMAPQQPLPDEDAARIVLPARLPLPPVGMLDGLKGPVLINLWSSTCLTCEEELSRWGARADEFAAAGLRVLAWCADPSGTLPAAPFEYSAASSAEVRALDLFQRSQLDRWSPLPVPSSFLIDSRGEVAVIYKGAVAVDQIVEDVRLLDAKPDVWRRAALPFDGRFVNEVPAAEPARVVSQLIDAAQLELGLRYLERYAESNPVGDDGRRLMEVLRGELAPRDPGAQLLAKADALRDAGDTASAIAAYRDVLRSSPRTLAAAERLAWLLMDQPGGLPEANALAERLCAITKNQEPSYVALREAVKKRQAEASE